MTALLFLVVTLLASIVGAISGIGGGILIKPVLELLSDLPVESIAFLSGCTVLSMSAVSLVRRRKQIADFELRRGTYLAVGSALGGMAGKLLFDEIRGVFGANAVGICQAVLLALMAAGLIVYVVRPAKHPSRDVHSGVGCALIGGALGVLSAFLGIGGGPLNLAALSLFLSMDNRCASIHSIYIILFSQVASLMLTFARHKVPPVPVLPLAYSILGGVLGALLGSALAAHMGNKALGRLYTAILVFVLILALANLSSYI